MSQNNSNEQSAMLGKIKAFREKYPDGKIAVNISNAEGCIMARARIYPMHADDEKNFLAEITFACEKDEKEQVSITIGRAQTQAIDMALQYAGIGITDGAPNADVTDTVSENGKDSMQKNEQDDYEVIVPEKEETEPELTFEQRYQQALLMPCPIAKYKDKTLGHVLNVDPHAIKWIKDKFTSDSKIQEAAKVICEYALQATA